MKRLRIVVEETGPDAFEVIYCGSDASKADSALKAPTTKDRALYVKPSVTKWNRPLPAPTKPAPESGAKTPPSKTKSTK